MPDVGPSRPLAEMLRAATAATHTAAERSSFVQRLFRGALPRDAYVAFLRSLHPVYSALEEAMRAHRHHPAVASVWDPALQRADRLEKDLVLFAGPQWSALSVVAPAASRRSTRRILRAERRGRMLMHAGAVGSLLAILVACQGSVGPSGEVTGAWVASRLETGTRLDLVQVRTSVSGTATAWGLINPPTRSFLVLGDYERPNLTLTLSTESDVAALVAATLQDANHITAVETWPNGATDSLSFVRQ